MKKLVLVAIACLVLSLAIMACNGGKKCPAYDSLKFEIPSNI
jgi:hypothetical protein